MALEEKTQAAITRKKGKATPGRRTRKVKTTASEPQGNAITRPLYRRSITSAMCAPS